MRELDDIILEMAKLFPNARCELNYGTPFQLAVAVMLSAQTTDARVNIVTKKLFKKYPDCYLMAKADINDIKQLIKSIGLTNNKANNLSKMSKELIEYYDGIVPNTRSKLVKLSGIGVKSANVILAEVFKIPAVPVDTHVTRVSKRLKFCKENDDVLAIEKKLKRKISRNLWIQSHHLIIFFGRYQCTAKNPKCGTCPFTSRCRYYKKNF